jgi:glutamate formiminotransferase/formiminotetrahydrofolate cyclodeaminase
MKPIVECVPNFSEGRDPAVLDAIVSAMTAVPGVTLLGREMDASHNRSVVTLVGDGEAVLEAAFRGAKEALARIDLTKHEGEHPRMGAVDVIPFVPVRGVTMADCIELARRLGKRLGEELNFPVFLYEEAATRPERKNLADVRRGQFEGLREAIPNDPARKPDFGPSAVHPTGGAVAVGARPFLVACNVYLGTPDVQVAKKVAAAVRGANGGLQFVKALGFFIEERGLAQVSMNLVNTTKTPIHRVVEMIRSEAARYGVPVLDTEIVGLVPEDALLDAAEHYLRLNHFERDQVLEKKLAEPARGAAGTLDDFLGAVAADTPTPGGGSVAALAGALAASLGAMVAGLTVGKKKYAEVSDAMASVKTRLAAARVELTRLVEEDAAAFEAVMAARKLPAGNPTETATKERAQAEADERAIAVPFETARRALAVLEDLVFVAERGNTNAVTDAGVAALLARAAVQGAAWNVLVNLGPGGGEGGAGEKSAARVLELKLWTRRADDFSRNVGQIVDRTLGYENASGPA